MLHITRYAVENIVVIILYRRIQDDRAATGANASYFLKIIIYPTICISSTTALAIHRGYNVIIYATAGSVYT